MMTLREAFERGWRFVDRDGHIARVERTRSDGLRELALCRFA
jgi:hypothetical protein